jgi:hypothetical protein
LVFYRYLPYRYQQKSRLVHFSIKILAGAPFFLQKGGLGPLLEHSAPLLREKGYLVDFFKKRVPINFKKEFTPNPTVQKIPTRYTNRLMPVPYRYRPDGQSWDGKQHYKLSNLNTLDSIQPANSHPDSYHIPSETKTKNTSAYSLHLNDHFYIRARVKIPPEHIELILHVFRRDRIQLCTSNHVDT